MIRRLNYTGRKKIPRSRVHIRVHEHGGQRSFDARLELSGLALPEDAELYVEAYYRSAFRRFGFGTVGRPVAPADRSLAGIPARHPLFRVKAVVRENGLARIVAAADRVLPQQTDHEDEERASLLPVEYSDLGERIWKLDLSGEWPTLHLNRNFEGIGTAARQGPEFFALVYPEVLRAVLQHILQEQRFDPDSDDDDWGTLWLRFACNELGQPRPPQADVESATVQEWIEQTVNAFCMRIRSAAHFRVILERNP